jgi:vacuolar-type H+-ATPase subunit F/Vma7
MTLCAFIGDEVTATGFRLAGVDVHVPERAQAPALLRRLLGESELILVTAEVAGWLPQDLLRRALAANRPPILVLADVRGRVQPPDLSSLLRRQLGMAE